MVKVGVIGSISTDFVVTSQRKPLQGETIFGESFHTTFGGKGANQAVATARLGGETFMFGAVGDDSFAKSLLQNLEDNAINTEAVKNVKEMSSGSAVINVVNGDNSIIYVAGANGMYKPDDLLKNKELLSQMDVLMVQNETPNETIETLIKMAKEKNIKLIYNPAPARAFDLKYLDEIFCITPNETEFEVMFPGEEMSDVLMKYPNKIIITLGSEGVIYSDGDKIIKIPAFKVENVVDTTGAGDTFNGAFAVAIGSGMPMLESIRFANLASSISIQKSGAQNGIPTLSEMKRNENYEATWNIK